LRDSEFLGFLVLHSILTKEMGVVDTPIIPALRWLRQEDGEFQAWVHSEFQTSLGYIVRLCLQKKKKKRRKEGRERERERAREERKRKRKKRKERKSSH
jgi:heme exporter protein D